MDTKTKKKESSPILIMKDVSKAFPGVQALRRVNLTVLPGEIHGLVGKNGAGKSTLMAILMGITEPNEGTIEIDGKVYTSMSSREAIDSGIAYVPQHVAMMDSLSVAENILAGDLPKNKIGFISWKKVNQEAEERLKRLNLHLEVTKKVEGLGVAEQTMLAIAKALFGNAKLIILDEPTAPLSRSDINRLFNFVKSLKDKGVAFVYISHHLEEVFEICDRVTVMRDGRVVDTKNVKNIDIPQLIVMMVGEGIEEYSRESTCSDEIVFILNNLTRRGYYEDITLELRKGEVIGITGLQGCGSGQLGKGLFGLEYRGIGEVKIKGKQFTAKRTIDSFNKGLAYLPQERYRYGLVGVRPMRENVTYPILNRLVNVINLIDRVEEKEIVDEFINGLEIITPNQEQPVQLLSGGNQQKVVFAKLASTKPNVLILHEPTQGVDVRAKIDVFRIIDELAEQGVATIVISSEIRELIGICDRILVMNNGRLTHEYQKGAKDTTPENILAAIEGGKNNNG